MKQGIQNLGNLAVLAAALAVIVIGVTMSFTHARSRPAAVSARSSLPAPQSPQPPLPSSQAPPAAAPSAAPAVTTADVAAALPKLSAAKPAPVQKPAAAASVSAPPPRRRHAPRQYAAGNGPVPPLLPPLYGPQLTGTALRPPDVLRLTGIVEGQERLALMRRGENRYMARLGDTVDGQRIVGISASSVVLQRGTRKRTLRLSKQP